MPYVGHTKTQGTVPSGTDDADNPVKVGGVARTTNPTAAANLKRIDAIYDKVGRAVMTPYHVRDLISSATVTLETTAAANLIGGVSGVFLDLLEITCANGTGAVHTIALREVAGSTGTVKTFQVPSNDTRVFTFPAPLPQSEAGSSWEVQDVTPGLVDPSAVSQFISATFARNV